MTDLPRTLVAAPPGKASGHRRLREMQERIPANADVVLIGDSLAASWPAEGLSAIWPDAQIVNLGLPGDRVQNVSWRLDQLALGHLRPRTCLMLVGTNNLGDGDPADAILAGIGALRARLSALWPDAGLLVMTLPWRAALFAGGEGVRLAVNAGLARSSPSGDRHRTIEVDDVLGRGPEMGRACLDPDGLHLNPEGYRRLTDALVRMFSRDSSRAAES